VLVSRSGLVTVTGGKWTTYRAMAEDVLGKCMADALLPHRPGGATLKQLLVGANAGASSRHPLSQASDLSVYGTEAAVVEALPGSGRQLGGGLTEAMVRFAVRHEYARTVEDVLARRVRLLFLDARLAGSLAAAVGAIVAEETGCDPEIAAFEALAAKYLHLPA
jgi:glycerol-3-phosphate dehydrogenase